MHVAVAGAQARLIVLPSDSEATQAAIDFINRVDPPSQGVPLRQASFRKKKKTTHFSGSSKISMLQYLLAIGQTRFTKCLIICCLCTISAVTCSLMVSTNRLSDSIQAASDTACNSMHS